MLQVPSAYRAGYEKARGFDAALADNYARHITMGDPELDPVMEELSSISPPQLHRFIAAGIEGQDEELRKAPEPLRNFFKNLEDPPWLNHDAFRPGISTFGKNVTLMLTAFVTGVLVEGFSTLIAKSFNITGRVASEKRRLQQNNRHMMEIFYPLGLRRDGDGWKLSTRIRFAHSRVRSLLDKSRDWKHETWGSPVSAAHLGFAISVFSMRLLEHSVAVGAQFTKEETKSVLDVWRYAGYLMGIPESILYTNAEDAKKIYRLGYLIEPPADEDSIAVANLLITSIPKIANMTDEKECNDLVNLAYTLSRALIGNRLADSFNFPKTRTLGTLFSYRMQQRLRRLLKGTQMIRSENFTQLFEISVYEDRGLSYRMPDHVYSSKSSKW